MVNELVSLHTENGYRVLLKPAGISVLKDNTGTESLGDLYQQQFKEPPLWVHRLDKGTSGLLVVARTAKVRSVLSACIARGDFHKTYLALVHGTPEPPDGLIDQPLEKARKGSYRIAPTGQGLPCLTRYQLLSSDGRQSLLLVQPLTGRTHQIRVHLKHLGHPLVRDPVYGLERGKPSQKPVLTLHAWKLAFPHPESGEPVAYEAPLPEWGS